MSKSIKADAIYLRVSTKQQDTKSQEPDLKRWAESREGKVVWYNDSSSGMTMDRPAWKKLEADIRAGKIGSVVVWRLDRLGRTAKGLTALFDELRERKVNLISLKDGIDLATSAGRLMANVLASVAQYETELRRERVLAGQSVAKAEGKRWGGSIKGKRKKVKPQQVKAILHLHKEGEPITRIAKAVHLSRPTIYDVLSEASAE
jgi:DNA invertase Pin-like site-specific DNA recombinase